MDGISEFVKGGSYRSLLDEKNYRDYTDILTKGWKLEGEIKGKSIKGEEKVYSPQKEFIPCTTEGNILEPFYSYDLHAYSGDLYIPSSDVLFLKQTSSYNNHDEEKHKTKIVAYNIEFGTWTSSEKVPENEFLKEAKNLLQSAFKLNLEFMFRKILYAIRTENYKSIFTFGEEFMPTLRGINTHLQKEIELKIFIEKVKGIDSADEKDQVRLDKILENIRGKWFDRFEKQSADFITEKLKAA